MDDFIAIVYHFGGRWVDDNGGRRYIDGGTFENPVPYEVDYFGFWNMSDFYTKSLGMRTVRLTYIREVDGEEIELLNDADVLRMIEEQRPFPKTRVFGLELGENVAPLDKLKKRLKADLKKHNMCHNDTWSSSDDDRPTGNQDEDSSDDSEYLVSQDEESSDDTELDEETDLEELIGVAPEVRVGEEEIAVGAEVRVGEEEIVVGAEVQVGEEEIAVGAEVRVGEEEIAVGAEVRVGQEEIAVGAEVRVSEEATAVGAEVQVGEEATAVGAEVQVGEEATAIGAEVRVGEETRIDKENLVGEGSGVGKDSGVDDRDEVRPRVRNEVDRDEEDPIILDDEELREPLHFSDDDQVKEWPWFNPDLCINGKPELTKGMKFKSVDVLRRALKDLSLITRGDYEYLKNNKQRVTVICKLRCGFRVHASVISDDGTFQIKSLCSNHLCPVQPKNHLVDSRYICTRFLEDFRDNPDWKLSSISKFLQKRLGMTIGLQRCYRAKKKAQKIIEGDAKDQYNKLRTYGDAISTSNPGSMVMVCTEDGPPGYVKEVNPVSPLEFEWVPLPPVPLFKYMYIRFAAQKYAFFAGIRPFVGLDGCFLKGVMGGQLLSAVARDGNNTMYPLAIAVVDLEDKKSWGWFLENLIRDFGHPSQTGMVFMSDKQKGLQEAMYKLMPGVEHRFCVKHLYENFKVNYKGQEYKELLWNAASTGSKTKLKFYLDQMKKLPNGEEAVNFLMKNEPSSWSRSHFSPHCKTPLIVNNISESFNASILPGRDKPILTMLEWIRRKMMKKIHTKQAKMEKYEGNLCPAIVKQMERTMLDAANCFATAAGSNLYEVDLYGTTTVVDINAKTCTCRMWELSGIPCKHGVAAIYANRQQPEAFVDNCYSRQTYMAVYGHSIKPLSSPDEWPQSDKGNVHPPNFRKPTGRPKKKRTRAADEAKPQKVSLRRGGDVKCGNCKQLGHNARTCKAARIGETPYQRRQRIKRARSAQSSQTTEQASQSTMQASQSNVQASQPTIQGSETS